MKPRKNRFVNRPKCLHGMLSGQCSICRPKSDTARNQRSEPTPTAEGAKRDAVMWADYVEGALTQAGGWGEPAAALRGHLRRALSSKSLRDLREAARAYDAFRAAGEAQRLKQRPGVAPFSPEKPPRGCGVRREDGWGPKGSWILSGGRIESNR